MCDANFLHDFVLETHFEVLFHIGELPGVKIQDSVHYPLKKIIFQARIL